MDIKENKKYYTIEISNRSPKKYLERDLSRSQDFQIGDLVRYKDNININSIPYRTPFVPNSMGVIHDLENDKNILVDVIQSPEYPQYIGRTGSAKKEHVYILPFRQGQIVKIKDTSKMYPESIKNNCIFEIILTRETIPSVHNFVLAKTIYYRNWLVTTGQICAIPEKDIEIVLKYITNEMVKTVSGEIGKIIEIPNIDEFIGQ